MKYFFLKGMIKSFKSGPKSEIGLISAIKVFKEVLTQLNVPFKDECCDATILPTVFLSVAQNDIAAGAGGAIGVDNYLTTINTDAGGDAFTLADGTVVGQLKKILLVVDGGGDAVITPATAFAGGATATLDDAGDYLILQWNGSSWLVTENSGVTIA